jgi:hypothetical protein
MQPTFLQTLSFPGVPSQSPISTVTVSWIRLAVLLFGNGNSTFTTGPSLTLPGPLIAIADFNGDGKADLLTGGPQSSTAYAVLLGNGDGTFQAEITTNVVPAVVVADVNGDGKPDISVLSQAARCSCCWETVTARSSLRACSLQCPAARRSYE